MPNFAYTARDAQGQSVNGTLAAATAAEASKLLRAEGKFPTAVRPAAEAADSNRPAAAGRRGIKVTRVEVIQFSTQLAIMLETGVTLVEAIDCIRDQADKPPMKKLLADLSAQISAGGEFSAALARHPRSFPRIYVALIKASEKSGMLPMLLGRATDYMRDEQEVLRKVRGAITYPGIMLLFAIKTTVFLLIFVLPRFTKIYAGKGAALPTPTKILMNMSDFILHDWMFLVPGLLAAAAGFYFGVRTDPGERLWHSFQLRMPLMGPMFRKLHLSRGIRMIGTMAGAGVGLTDCVETARDLCTNRRYRELWETVGGEIRTGRQLSDPLFESPLVPKSVAQMLHSGEKGGRLASVMEQVAGWNERELKETIADLTRYIEPAMIVVMGVIIGGVSLALMLPIFTISKVVAK